MSWSDEEVVIVVDSGPKACKDICWDLKAYIPNVFARKPRGLNIIDRWKATELRQFLLYSGKLALKGILRRDLYDHFIVLSVALCILVCQQTAIIHNNYANELLLYFVEKDAIYMEENF